MPEETLAFCLRQVVEALVAFHSLGIPHGRVHTSSVFVPDDGVVKLAGTSFLDGEGEGGEGGGEGGGEEGEEGGEGGRGGSKVPWCSPEEIRKETVGAAADIWAVGCLAVHMATGALPWAQVGDEDQVRLFIAHSRALPDLPPDSSPQLIDFVATCLDRDPSRRPTAARLVDHPFLAAC
ncbi:unnamed protein product [Closterium sp. Yama58-4]|nr:unnamed protein product [Closterium sp. Yama58-4]